ncbi:MAG: DUF898 family protein, partial [Gammaproteobacteria bacterium]
FYALLADGLFWQRYPDEIWEIIWSVLALLFLLSLPLFVRAYHCYKAGRHTLGGLRFYLHKPPVLGYYGALIVPFLCAAGGIYSVLWAVVFIGIKREEDLSSQFGLAGIIIGGTILISVVLTQFAQAALFRLFWGNLRARNDKFEGRFVCDINIWHFAFRILLVNVVAVIMSLGLLHPWAKIRKTRYLVQHIHIIAPTGAMSSLAAREGKKELPLGEELEVAEGFDFDVGLI